MNKYEIIELLGGREFKGAKEVLEQMNVVDIASLLGELDDKESVQVFRLIKKETAAQVFTYMDNFRQSELVKMLTQDEVTSIIADMFIDDAVDFLEDLPANVVNRILDNIDKTKRESINKLLNYPEDSAGSIMTTEYVDIRQNMTVKESMVHIKQVGIDKETIYTCYVLEKRRLIGIVEAKDLLVSDDDVLIKDIMKTNFKYVNTHSDQEEVGKLFAKYSLLAMPVLDLDGFMVGIVTVDDAVDVIVEEATEDMTVMAAMTPSEDNYFNTSVFQHAKHRILWLLILMLSATFTGMIITKYEGAFQVVPLLVSFIPMLMDTGGNCGSQSSTLVIRGIALEEIEFKDIFKVVYKEFRISILVGMALAVANGIRILIMYKDIKLACVVGISLTATVIISKFIGGVLPLVAKKLKLDPAIMAAPLITTLVDTCSIVIYFFVATRVFNL
ncbi:magnesium transporter [Hathewaya proteolytica DSM 3090]|uniref:Magnesium transporter MgtE n=1 Tax=Hathewaya proteolytica DSM 3090 TaxID=1121331 RepID=A0A1M6TA84_9CLOT|nr:magnesium transporter [Hathewaya proteolytica]SHK53804.1 magnesium transporter [Hathewaya proteolytica DSM 3090]